MSELFVVATPIGNLADISRRAREVLASVDLIAAEDTRHSKKLLQSAGIATPLTSYHDFSSDQTSNKIRMLAGEKVDQRSRHCRLGGPGHGDGQTLPAAARALREGRRLVDQPRRQGQPTVGHGAQQSKTHCLGRCWLYHRLIIEDS